MTVPPTCCVQGCAEQIEWRRVMCATHWDMVPRSMQDRIADTWDDPEVCLDETLDAAQTVYLLLSQERDLGA